ncbi:ribonuclease Z [Bacteroidota bacterium]
MTFSVTILGSNSAIPTLHRNPSAHLVNLNERLFLIDCAEGTQLQLRKYKIHFQRIRHIMISHLHGDHYFGLIGFLTTMHLLGRKDELHIYAPARLEEIIQIQLDVSFTVLNYPLIFHPLVSGGLELLFEDERVTVHSFPLLHSIPTFGFIFREKIKVRKIPAKRSYAYCSDTAYDERIIPFVSGVDLLYHETTFMKDKAAAAADKMHSTTIEAATIAKKSKVKKLLIGHFSARYDDLFPLLEEAKTLFPETFLAEDGITIQV